MRHFSAAALALCVATSSVAYDHTDKIGTMRAKSNFGTIAGYVTFDVATTGDSKSANVFVSDKDAIRTVSLSMSVESLRELQALAEATIKELEGGGDAKKRKR
jgi:hypothetical protein